MERISYDLLGFSEYKNSSTTSLDNEFTIILKLLRLSNFPAVLCCSLKSSWSYTSVAGTFPKIATIAVSSLPSSTPDFAAAGRRGVNCMDADLPHDEEDVKGLYEEEMAPNLARTSPASSTNHQMPPSSDASTSESPPLGLNLGLDLLQQPSGSYSCVSCHRKFPTAKLLQQHNQSFHSDKHFVCETCGKAFRFRSNLAEHRSVHTALKPFVCRFCGKSSRLKGWLPTQ